LVSGHVSKASDVYAYGILLYELMTAKRAYVGIPIPLLPHQVALQGLRPEWPEGLPRGCRDLKKLAEACWAHKPQDRCARLLLLFDVCLLKQLCGGSVVCLPGWAESA
jgi:serine/threonine protein kinase